MPDARFFTKAEISSELNKAYQEVTTYIQTLENSVFDHDYGDKWSPMQQLWHLILSSKGIPSMLRMPKQKLLMFGKAGHTTRSYDLLMDTYKNKLKTGVKAGPEFSPTEGQKWSKEELLANWKLISDKFSDRLQTWSEEELDTYQVPHPALGLLTIREMLFFTIYHSRHHLKSMQDLTSE